MKNKKIITALFLVSTLFLTFNATQVAQVGAQSDSPYVNGESTGENTIVWDHLSVITVWETITDLGGGTWEYSFHFENTDTNSIYDFAIYTMDPTTAWTPFTLPGWTNEFHPLSTLYPIYQAWNLDPSLNWFSVTHGTPWINPSDPITVGLTVTGFSFQMNVFDPSPKHYMYNFVGNDPRGIGGKVSAVGTTVLVQPGSLFSDVLTLFPLGIMAAVTVVIRRRRKAYN